MAPKPKGTKELMHDKDKLLELAETIASGRERDIRQKIDRTKAATFSHDGPRKHKTSQRPTSGASSASGKLRAAKQLVAARKTKHKREKIKARKSQARSSGEATIDTAPSLNASSKPADRKRVSFA